MLTKKDILLLKETFATKEDLLGFSTKEDAKNFLTKEDAKNFATRDDLLTFKDEIMFQILAMRDELAIVIGYRSHIEDHEIRIEKLEEQVLNS